MKLTLPKPKKFKISIRTFTTITLAALIIFEFYLAYFSLYQKLSPEPEITVNTSIVRINRKSLNEITTFLDGLTNFLPQEIILANPNPFKYSP